MKTSHVVFASGTALAGGRAFVFSLSKLLFTQKKTLQINLSWVLYSRNLAFLGWSPKLCAELEGSLGTEPRSEEWTGSLEKGGLRLPKIFPKLAFHQAGKR